MKSSEFIEGNIDIFCCPRCKSDLNLLEGVLTCDSCDDHFPILGDIPQLFCSNQWDESKKDVTNAIKSFYEKTPFPNYDQIDDVASLRMKASKSLFGKWLDEQIPFGTRILECGCGTGQLTNFLSLSSRTAIGTDICMNSLGLASRFKELNELKRAYFCQMNLFNPCFKKETFDLVISNGVLHHTSDPLLGFMTIANLVKPGGYILIGLYHKYGRLATDIRRLIFKYSKDRFKFLDRRVVSQGIDEIRRQAWYLDQYKNPHESKHTVGEVLKWLDQSGLEFIHSIPKTTLFEGVSESEKLFKADRLGNVFERFLQDVAMIFPGHKEGGFFTVIAKKVVNKLQH